MSDFGRTVVRGLGKTSKNKDKILQCQQNVILNHLTVIFVTCVNKPGRFFGVLNSSFPGLTGSPGASFSSSLSLSKSSGKRKKDVIKEQERILTTCVVL